MNHPFSGDSDNQFHPEKPAQEQHDATARTLVRAVRDGKQEAFSEIVKLYQRQVFGLALMVVRDRAAAEDVSQEAFVRAYTQLAQYDEQRQFYPWLATIAVRLAQNWLRTQARASAREDAVVADDTDHGISADFLGELIADESGKQLWNNVAVLPDSERTAVLLYYRQDMKVADIATVLDVTSGTIKTLLHRARQKLRANLLENDQ